MLHIQTATLLKSSAQISINSLGLHSLTEIMPVTGLPFALEIMLEQLLCLEMPSWQIYNQKNGSVCVKLRFKGEPNTVIEGDKSSVETTNQVQQTSYRKLSCKQLQRNRDRAEAFRKESVEKGVITRSQSKKDDISIEKPRDHSNSTGESAGESADLHLELSPVSVVSTSTGSSHTPLPSPINIASPSFNNPSQHVVCTDNRDTHQNDHIATLNDSLPSEKEKVEPLDTCEITHQRVCHYIDNNRRHTEKFHMCEGCGVYICVWCLMGAKCHAECKKKQINRKTTYT